MKQEQGSTLISIILIIILGCVVYCNSLNNKFVWDDHILVENNTYINNWSKVPHFFTKNIAMGGGEKFNSYRPLQMITYMIDYSLWKLDVRGYHFTNIFLHILATLSLYWLISILFKDKLISLLTSILFVVHPIHTEVVTYISGRADSLAALFIILCLIFYIKYLHFRNLKTYMLMLLSCIFALLSRENSLVLPALLLLYHYTFKKKFMIKGFLSIAAITFIYIIFRITVLKSLMIPIIYSGTLSQRIPGFFVALTNYTRLLLLPFGLHMEYGQQFFNIMEPKVIAGIAISFAILIYVFKNRKSKGLIFFSVGWFFITLFPSSNIYPLNAYMAEHWLYLPAIGFFLILAKALSSLCGLKKFRALTIVFIIALLLFYSYLTLKQNTYWREPISFYERTLKYAPHSARTHLSLGDLYSNMGRKEEAISLLKRAIELSPNHPYVYNNLGNIYMSIGKIEEAVEVYNRGIEMDPNYAGTYNNLANTYSNIGRKEEALILYKKAIELNPNLVQAYNNLGIIYYEIGRKEEAIKLYKKAIELNPNIAEVYSNLGRVYYDIGRKEEAINSYKKAIELNPNLALPNNNLGFTHSDSRKKRVNIEIP